MTRIPRSVLIACLSALVGSLADPAPAALASPAVLAKPKPPLTGKKPVAVGVIAGKRVGKVRALVFERLKESNAYEVTDTEDLKPGDNKATIAKNAKALNVAGVVMGRVSEKFDLTLVIYNADGKLVREVVIKGGTPQKLENAIRNEFNMLAGPAIAQATGGKNIAETKPPTEEVVEEEEEEPDSGEEEPKEDKAEEEEEKEDDKKEEKEDDKKEEEEDEDKGKDDKPSKPGLTPFELIAGIRGINRQFKYSEPQTALYPYSLGFGPALFAGGRIYPFAFVRDDFLGNIGLFGQSELSIATSTDFQRDVAGGGQIVQKLENAANEWSIGLIVRVPIDNAELDVFGAFGQQTFIVKGDEGGTGLPPLVPDVKYQYIRPGLEGRARFSEIFASVHAAPRILTSKKNIDLEGTWFPGATGFAFDFGLMGGYGVLPFLDVVLGFDFVRYGFDFSGVPKTLPPCVDTNQVGCQKTAGGASDTYLSGWLGARVHLGGSSKK